MASPHWTLSDWMQAHRKLVQEEGALARLAQRHRRPPGCAEELERQRQRVAAAQDAADAIYERVMQDLRGF